MRHAYLSAIFMLTALMAVAQESPRAYSSAVKLYNLTDWEDYSFHIFTGDTSYYNQRQSSLRILHPTIAYQWQSKKEHYHELELVTLQLAHTERASESTTPALGGTGQVDVSEITTRLAVSIRYEYQMSLRPKNEKSWDLSLGAGVNPYYFFQVYSSEKTTVFPTSVSSFGTRFFAIPRFTWHMSPRFFLDVNIPICLAEFRYQYLYDENPVLPIGDRGQHNLEFSQLPPLFSGRIGIGLKLN